MLPCLYLEQIYNITQISGEQAAKDYIAEQYGNEPDFLENLNQELSYKMERYGLSVSVLRTIVEAFVDIYNDGNGDTENEGELFTALAYTVFGDFSYADSAEPGFNPYFSEVVKAATLLEQPQDFVNFIVDAAQAIEQKERKVWAAKIDEFVDSIPGRIYVRHLNSFLERGDAFGFQNTFRCFDIYHRKGFPKGISLEQIIDWTKTCYMNDWNLAAVQLLERINKDEKLLETTSPLQGAKIRVLAKTLLETSEPRILQVYEKDLNCLLGKLHKRFGASGPALPADSSWKPSPT